MRSVDSSNTFSELVSSAPTVSFEHVNPHSGHESFLLRFEDSITEETTCLLVDAGANVSLATLDDDEHLNGVLLTHAHLDHYRSLPDVHRDRAPIYTSPATADILETVFESGQANYGLDPNATSDVVDHLEPVSSGWTSVTNSLEVAPLPAGHAPGACGFLLRFSDGFGPHHILITGDFSTHSVAGYPAFDPPDPLVDGSVEIDALFLTQAVSESSGWLTEALRIGLERIRDGSPTVVTTNGLTGVQVGTLLATAREERFEVRDDTPPIILAGQVAKLYEDLDYDVGGVKSVPVFEDPGALIEEGAAVISGPEVPIEGGSHRCFQEIKDDPNATLVQLHTPATDPVDSARCTIHDVQYQAHPPQSVLDDLVATIDPYEIVIVHDRTHDPHYHEDNSCFVWAPDHQEHHELYVDGKWLAPSWVSEHRVQQIQSNRQISGETTTLGEESLPSLERRDEIDLESEGIDVGVLPGSSPDSRSDLRLPAVQTEPVEAPDTRSDESEADDAGDSNEEESPPSRAALAARIDELEAVVESLAKTEADEEPESSDPSSIEIPVTVIDGGEDLTLLRVESDRLDQLPHSSDLTIDVAAELLRDVE